MSRTPVLKYLDKHEIHDGVLRVFANHKYPNKGAILGAIETSIKRRQKEIDALRHLENIINQD